MANRGALERAPVIAELVRLLALGQHTQTELGERYAVSPSAISRFAVRHVDKISRQRDRLDDQFAGIVYADKIARVAELSAQIEQIADLMADPDQAARAGVQAAEMWRTVQTALRNIAEEKGELPSRHNVQVEGGVTVRYELVGVDVEDLA